MRDNVKILIEDFIDYNYEKIVFCFDKDLEITLSYKLSDDKVNHLYRYDWSKGGLRMFYIENCDYIDVYAYDIKDLVEDGYQFRDLFYSEGEGFYYIKGETI